MNKKAIWGIVAGITIILIVVGVTFFRYKILSKITWKTYSDDRYGFSFNYPGSDRLSPAGDLSSVSVFSHPSPTDNFSDDEPDFVVTIVDKKQFAFHDSFYDLPRSYTYIPTDNTFVRQNSVLNTEDKYFCPKELSLNSYDSYIINLGGIHSAKANDFSQYAIITNKDYVIEVSFQDFNVQNIVQMLESFKLTGDVKAISAVCGEDVANAYAISNWQKYSNQAYKYQIGYPSGVQLVQDSLYDSGTKDSANFVIPHTYDASSTVDGAIFWVAQKEASTTCYKVWDYGIMNGDSASSTESVDEIVGGKTFKRGEFTSISNTSGFHDSSVTQYSIENEGICYTIYLDSVMKDPDTIDGLSGREADITGFTNAEVDKYLLSILRQVVSTLSFSK